MRGEHSRCVAGLRLWGVLLLALGLSADPGCSGASPPPLAEPTALEWSGAERVAVPDSVDAVAEGWTHFAIGFQAEQSGRHQEALVHYGLAERADPDRPEILIRKSSCLQELRRHGEAARAAEQALALDSLAVEGLWALAVSRAAMGDPERALAPLTKLVELDPDPRVHRLMSTIYERWNRPQEALEHLDALLELLPPSPHLLDRRAGLLLRLGRQEDALAEYWTLLDLAPEYPGLIEQLGSLLQRLDREEELVRLYRRLVEVHPEQPPLRWKLIELLLTRGRWDEARIELEHLRAQRPEDGLAALQLALVTYRRGEPDQALGMITEARALGADPVQSWRWVMRIQFAQGRCPEALVAADSLLEHEGSDHDGWRIRALCLAESGRYDEALQAIDVWGGLDSETVEPLLLGAAICREEERWERGLVLLGLAREREPQDSAIALEQAAFLEALDRFEEAEQAVQGALVASPDSPEALNFLGYLWVDRGLRLDEAEVLIGRALEAEPENPAYLDSMGWLWYKRGDLGQAEQWLQKAVDRGGRHPEIYAHLARVKVEKGSIGEARRTLEAGLEWSPQDSELLDLLLSLEDQK